MPCDPIGLYSYLQYSITTRASHKIERHISNQTLIAESTVEVFNVAILPETNWVDAAFFDIACDLADT